MKKVLIADDDPNVLTLLKALLEEEPYKLLHAMNGVDTLNLAQKEMPDLILLDIMIPEPDGLEVCKILKSDPLTAKIKIIFVTAKAMEKDRIIGMEAGADFYVTKPFKLNELKEKIKELLS